MPYAIKVVNVIQMHQYDELVSLFLKELYIKFNLKAIKRELTLAEEVLSDDFSLVDFNDEFWDNLGTVGPSFVVLLDPSEDRHRQPLGEVECIADGRQEVDRWPHSGDTDG
jgi:hypothetical protein